MTSDSPSRAIPAGKLPLLSQLRRAPKTLYYRGCLPASEETCIAIVGARRASVRSQAIAAYLARELGKLGFWVVSGLAHGVDAAAHRGALSVRARTLAVLGHGLSYLYPPSNRALANRIVESGGALLSQFPDDTKPMPYLFPERNRTIAGLCKAVVLVQAGEKSGALWTAQFAVEEGREVFVIPGEFADPSFCGSHDWIRQGARLIHSVEDLLNDWGVDAPQTHRVQTPLSKRCRRFERYTFSEVMPTRASERPKILEALRLALKSGECLSGGPQTFFYLGN